MAIWNKNTQAYLQDNKTLFEAFMLSDKDGNIINSFGIASNIPIAAGELDGWAAIHKFGAVPLMSVNPGDGSVWDKSDTYYPWTAFAVPGPLTISTTTSNGTLSSLDTGMTVTIIGLDENFEDAQETITISGNAGAGTQNFARVYRAFTSQDNQTQVRVSTTTGTPTEVLRINILKGQTLMAVYTVPAGKTAYLTKGTATCAANADATIDMMVRYGGVGAFRIGHTAEIAGVGGQYTYEFAVPLQMPEKTDIDMRAHVRSNNARVTAAFDLIVIDNPA
jgi:hypothetical protein